MIHASDAVLLDVFLLHSFLWEVLEAPEKQGMLFGMTTVAPPPAGSDWSLADMQYQVPGGSSDDSIPPPYLQEGAWFGRTQAVARLLSAAGGVPVASPAGLYLTGILASAAGLHKSPVLFNTWWRDDGLVLPRDLGMVLGWLNSTLSPPRSQVWEMLKKHHNFSNTGQIVKRDVEVDLTTNPNKLPVKLIKYTNSESYLRPTMNNTQNKTKSLKTSSNKTPGNKSKVIIARETYIPKDAKYKWKYLLRKEQLRQMLRTTNEAHKIPSKKVTEVKQSEPSRNSL